jgi:hypothetical protein
MDPGWIELADTLGETLLALSVAVLYRPRGTRREAIGTPASPEAPPGGAAAQQPEAALSGPPPTPPTEAR